MIAATGLEWTGVAWRLGATLFFVLLDGCFVAAESAGRLRFELPAPEAAHTRGGSEP